MLNDNQYDPRAVGVARVLAQTALGTNARSVYTVPAGRRAEVSSIVVANGHTSVATLAVYHVRPGESAGVANAQYAGTRLANGTTMIDDTPRGMLTGDAIHASASVGSVVTLTLYGREI